MGDKKEEDTVDTRLEFLSEYLLRTLKQKIDKWNKFIAGEERHILFRWFDTPTLPLLVFRMNTAGLLSCSLTFPPLARSKIVYFLRDSEERITQGNFRKITTMGEMSPNVLADIAVLANDVIGPMLTNPQNQKGWPKIVKYDMQKHVTELRSLLHQNDVIGPMLTNPQNQKGWPKIVKYDMQKHVTELRSLLHQLKGEMAGHVMLAMPQGVENIYYAETKLKESDGEDVDLFLKSNIEGMVIQWSKQIQDLLAETSLIAYQRQKFPLPIADINFYAQRLRNLEGIYSQLRDPRVKRMAQFLQDTNSVYFKCFRTMLTNVVAGVIEARDIYVYQRPLIGHFENFEATDFADAKPLIRPMLHCIGMLWGQSRYYCNVDKLIPLLREVCNLVIQQCTASIDPPSIFQGEPDEQLTKVKKAIHILDHFVETYEMNRDKIHTFFGPGVMPVHWSFDFNRVFMRFNEYMKRLHMIEEMLEVTVSLLKLEKVEFSGLRGKVLSNECLKLLEEYTLAYQELGNIAYDPADPEDPSFLVDREKFMKYVNEDVMGQLATLFAQGLDDCNSLDHVYKFFQVIGDLFHREPINSELSAKLPKLLKMLEENLDNVKSVYDEEMAKLAKAKGTERPMVDPYLPPVAGTLWWIHKLRQQIAAPMAEFIGVEDP
ncbi:dynein beta chain, ciliary [Phthorimaea operculella]|nr:dynein beta chain, ciliary [Phthorimaea operculella]